MEVNPNTDMLGLDELLCSADDRIFNYSRRYHNRSHDWRTQPNGGKSSNYSRTGMPEGTANFSSVMKNAGKNLN